MLRREEELRRRPKSWPRLATEIWLEPQGVVDEQLRSDDESISDHSPQADAEVAREQVSLRGADQALLFVLTSSPSTRADVLCVSRVYQMPAIKRVHAPPKKTRPSLN
jgi:hypothetical protein